MLNPRLWSHELLNPSYACINYRIQADACIIHGCCSPFALNVVEINEALRTHSACHLAVVLGHEFNRQLLCLVVLLLSGAFAGRQHSIVVDPQTLASWTVAQKCLRIDFKGTSDVSSCWAYQCEHYC